MPFIYLVDPLVCLGKPELYIAVIRNLHGYFDRVGQAMTPKETFEEVFIPATPQPTPQDLLVYFTSTEYSVVSRFAGTKFDPLATGHWGYTKFKPGKVREAASEVYVHLLDADVLAKLAFHELMHNKLGLAGDDDSVKDPKKNLHAGRNGLALRDLGPETNLTKENVTEMARAMRDPVLQWTDGVGLMLAARQLR